MRLSRFGNKYTRPSGIVQLMEDLGSALAGDRPVCMLGGGNPGHVPAVEARLRPLLRDIADDGDAFARTFGAYDSPTGDPRFLDALAQLLNEQCGWPVTARNIALTNGSQNAFFYLFNLFAGPLDDPAQSPRRMLLPLAPEYIGYADLFVDGDHFVAHRPRIELHDNGRYKYRVDFDTLAIGDDIGAICVSRPTNPTGNVLTDAEIAQLDQIARRHDIPLLIDNAYGVPFPGIIFSDATPHWNDNTVVCMSLSKFGLPGLRTGIVIAREEIIDAIASLNAITGLAPGSVGAALVRPLIESGEILRLSREAVQPFYRRKAQQALDWLRHELGDYPVKVHEPEGALFLWLWFDGLPIDTEALYQRLKARGVLILPGHYFFTGLERPWRHSHECIRLTYSQDEASVREGIRIIGDEVRRLYDG